MLLLSIDLLTALVVTRALVVYDLYENSQESFSPSLGSVTGTYNNSDLLFQALLLEQINHHH